MIPGSNPIDTGFGEETQIRIKKTTRDLIDSMKIIPREPANDCIVRIIAENNQMRVELSVLKDAKKHEL